MHVTRKVGPLLGPAALAALCLASFSLSARPAAAQTTVFTSFGPNNSFNQGVAYTVAGPMSAGQLGQSALACPSPRPPPAL